jgi:hypothetical protein
MSQQYARNWPPVSQSPADKLYTNKVLPTNYRMP